MVKPIKNFRFLQNYMAMSYSIAFDKNPKTRRFILVHWVVQTLFALHNLALFYMPTSSYYEAMVYIDLPVIMKMPRITNIAMSANPILYSYYYYLFYFKIPKSKLYAAMLPTLDLGRKRKAYFLADSRHKIIRQSLVYLNIFSLLMFVTSKFVIFKTSKFKFNVFRFVVVNLGRTKHCSNCEPPRVSFSIYGQLISFGSFACTDPQF